MAPMGLPVKYGTQTGNRPTSVTLWLSRMRSYLKRNEFHCNVVGFRGEHTRHPRTTLARFRPRLVFES
jgi:hypothetical protein